ncbi:MAG: hypothetical protein WBG08_14685 [Litorimonas sp.]
MPGPSIDVEERNPLGGLDRLATGIGLAVIAVFPTLFATAFMPWKLGPLLADDPPDGREGLILAPGAYLVLSLGVVLVMVGSLVSPELARFDGGMIGPRLAAEVSAAAREGDVWKTLSRVAPVFVIAILFGAMGRSLTRWAGPWWTLRVSLRASFYAVSTFICWLVLSSLAVDAVRRAQAGTELSVTPPGVFNLLVAGSFFWVYFWCFRSGGGLSVGRSAVLTAAMFGLALGLAFLSSLLLFSSGAFG